MDIHRTFCDVGPRGHSRSTAAGARVAATSYVVSVVFLISMTVLSLLVSDGEGSTIAGNLGNFRLIWD